MPRSASFGVDIRPARVQDRLRIGPGRADDGNIGLPITGSDMASVMFSAQTIAFYPFEGMVPGGGTVLAIAGEGVEGADPLSIAGTYNAISGQSSATWTPVDLGTMTSDQGTWSARPCP